VRDGLDQNALVLVTVVGWTMKSPKNPFFSRRKLNLLKKELYGSLREEKQVSFRAGDARNAFFLVAVKYRIAVITHVNC